MKEAVELITAILDSPPGPLDASTPLRAIAGCDSLAMVSLVVRLETLLQRELAESDLDALRTVGDVEQLLRAC